VFGEEWAIVVVAVVVVVVVADLDLDQSAERNLADVAEQDGPPLAVRSQHRIIAEGYQDDTMLRTPVFRRESSPYQPIVDLVYRPIEERAY